MNKQFSKRTSVVLDDEDARAMKAIAEWFGLTSESSVLRACLRICYRASTITLTMPAHPSLEPRVDEVPPSRNGGSSTAPRWRKRRSSGAKERTMAKKTTVMLDEKDMKAIEIVKKRYGQSSESGVLRLCLHFVACARSMTLDMSGRPSLKPHINEAPPHHNNDGMDAALKSAAVSHRQGLLDIEDRQEPSEAEVQ